MSRLALGTAQLGLDYGITNRRGRVSASEAEAILELAARNGVDTIDTARFYGDSEQVIGRHWPANANFRIVTKTPAFADCDDALDAVSRLRANFAASLEALRQPRIHALLLHSPADLLGPHGAALWSALEHIRDEGLAEKIGVSVYEPTEIDAILARFPITIIQLPFNALDQRLAYGGHLQRLAGAGVEIHARSLFLQGLLLADKAAIPAKFASLIPSLEELDRHFNKHGVSRLEGLLATALERPEIARLVVGATNAAELDSILNAEKRAKVLGALAPAELPEIDPRYLNPSSWGQL